MKYTEYVERVKKLLEDIQWSDSDHWCPVCVSNRNSYDGDHSPGCELDLLRKEMPE